MFIFCRAHKREIKKIEESAFLYFMLNALGVVICVCVCVCVMLQRAKVTACAHMQVCQGVDAWVYRLHVTYRRWWDVSDLRQTSQTRKTQLSGKVIIALHICVVTSNSQVKSIIFKTLWIFVTIFNILMLLQLEVSKYCREINDLTIKSGSDWVRIRDFSICLGILCLTF